MDKGTVPLPVFNYYLRKNIEQMKMQVEVAEAKLKSNNVDCCHWKYILRNYSDKQMIVCPLLKGTNFGQDFQTRAEMFQVIDSISSVGWIPFSSTSIPFGSTTFDCHCIDSRDVTLFNRLMKDELNGQGKNNDYVKENKDIVRDNNKEKDQYVNNDSGKENNVKENNQCIVCCDQAKDCVLMPCAHLALCFECSSKVDQCPLCRGAISNRIKIFN